MLTHFSKLHFYDKIEFDMTNKTKTDKFIQKIHLL